MSPRRDDEAVPGAPAVVASAVTTKSRNTRANAFTVPWIKFLSPSQSTLEIPNDHVEADSELRVGAEVVASWSKNEWLPAKVVMHSQTRKGIKYGVSFPAKNGTILQLSRNKIKTPKQMRVRSCLSLCFGACFNDGRMGQRASKVVDNLTKMDPQQLQVLKNKLSTELEVMRHNGGDIVRPRHTELGALLPL